MDVKSKCPICGYVYEGNTPPEVCPMCKNKMQTQKEGEADLSSLTAVDVDTENYANVVRPDSSALCESVLGNLVVLRSSVTAVYEIQEQINKLTDEGYAEYPKIYNCEEEVKNMQYALDNIVGTPDDIVDIKEMLLKELQENNKSSDSAYAYKTERKFKLINIIGTICISLGLFALVFLISALTIKDDIALSAGNAVASGLVPGLVYFFITFKLAKDHSYNKVLLNRRLKNRDTYLKTQYQKDLQDTIEYKKAELKRMINETQEKSNQSLQHVGQIRQDIDALALELRTEVNYLDSIYCGMIHKSDWENLDYIIYVFVTGRADNLKEALHLVDEQRRAEMIVNAIGMATNYLASNISSTIQSLRGELLMSMKEISSNLGNIRHSITVQNKQTQESMKKMIDLDKKMCDYSVKSYDMMSKINGTVNNISKKDQSK